MCRCQAVVRQVRRITIDGPLPSRIELEPVTAIVGLTMWTPTDPDAVIDAASYFFVPRDPSGTIIAPAPGTNWPVTVCYRTKKPELDTLAKLS